MSWTWAMASLRLFRPWRALPSACADQLPCQFQTWPMTCSSTTTSYWFARVFRSSTMPSVSRRGTDDPAKGHAEGGLNRSAYALSDFWTICWKACCWVCACSIHCWDISAERSAAASRVDPPWTASRPSTCGPPHPPPAHPCSRYRSRALPHLLAVRASDYDVPVAGRPRNQRVGPGSLTRFRASGVAE